MRSVLKILFKNKFTIIVTSAVFTMLFQNCSNSAVVFINQEQNHKPLQSNATGGGGNYDGKPTEGEYKRGYPNYNCPNSTVGAQGFGTVSSTAVNIPTDSCENVSITIPTTDQRLQSTNYNPDYFVLGHAIYERIQNNILNEEPIAEVLCQHKSQNLAIDVVTKTNHQLSSTQSKMYFAKYNSNSYSFRRVNPFSVIRTLNGNSLSYSTGDFQLNILKNSSGNYSTSATLQTIIDNENINISMNCTLAALTKIETKWELNNSLLNLAGLISYWPLSSSNVYNGSIIPDVQANNNLIYTSSDSLINKIFNGFTSSSLFFNGVSDVISSSSMILMPNTNANQTISLWFNTAQISPDSSLFALINPNTSTQINIHLNRGSKQINVSSWGGILLITTPIINYDDGNWHHIAYTLTAGTHRIYYDGVEVANSNAVANNGIPTLVNIGLSNASMNYFNGAMDEISYWSRALSAAEISQIYNYQFYKP